MALNPTTQDMRGRLDPNFDGKFNSLFPDGDKPDTGGGGPNPDDPPHTGDDVTGNIVSDGFESADMSAPGAVGFEWGGNLATSVVSSSHAVYNNGVISNQKPNGSIWDALEGDYCLRFRYGAGRDTWSEQRFFITQSGVTELWISWSLKVPENFEMLDGAGNNKFLRIWSGDYDPWDKKGGMELRQDGVDGSASVWLNSGDGDPSEPFISVPSDRGRWMNIAYNIKSESASGAGDGHQKLWRKWAGEIDYQLIVQKLNDNLSGVGAGFTEGYFMGYASIGYAQDNTEFLIDNVKLSTEPLVPVGTEGV